MQELPLGLSERITLWPQCKFCMQARHRDKPKVIHPFSSIKHKEEKTPEIFLEVNALEENC